MRKRFTLGFIFLLIVLLTSIPTVVAQQFAGTTLRVLVFDHTYHRGLKKLLPEFEQQTGMKVEIETPGFVVYNQRADLELAGATGAYDVMTMTFIYSGKWIAAGWATNLTPFINDPKLTDRARFDPDDFVAGALAPFKRGENLYALPFVAESTLMVYRKDIFDKYGLKLPDSFEELLRIAEKIHTKEVAAYLGRGRHGIHWIYPNYLQAYGGNFFAHPLEDMTPTFDSEAAIKSAEVMVKLYRDYGVLGVANIIEDECLRLMQQGKAAMWIDALAWVGAVADPIKSLVADKISYALPPGGPAGRFPQLAVHGLLIPAAAKRKEASWEYIKWALSKEVMLRIAAETAYPPVTRASVVNNPAYKEKYKWGGADIGALHMEAMKLAGTGYMVYRTVPEFPPIGDRVTIAITEIITGQKTANEAMRDCNRDVAAILTKAGYKIRK